MRKRTSDQQTARHMPPEHGNLQPLCGRTNVLPEVNTRLGHSLLLLPAFSRSTRATSMKFVMWDDDIGLRRCAYLDFILHLLIPVLAFRHLHTNVFLGKHICAADGAAECAFCNQPLCLVSLSDQLVLADNESILRLHEHSPRGCCRITLLVLLPFLHHSRINTVGCFPCFLNESHPLPCLALVARPPF